MKRFFVILSMMLMAFAAAPAFAQNADPAATGAGAGEPLNINALAGWGDWEKESLKSDDIRLAAFHNKKNEGYIEIVGKKLINKNLYGALIKSFESHLKNESGLNSSEKPIEKIIKIADGSERKGSWTDYEYTQNNVSIHVFTFSFQVENYAYIVIGYFSAAEAEHGRQDMTTLIQNMKTQPDADKKAPEQKEPQAKKDK